MKAYLKQNSEYARHEDNEEELVPVLRSGLQVHSPVPT